MNPRIQDAITVIMIQLVLTIPLISANAYGLTISNVKVSKVTENSAIIEWDTDLAAKGKVNYGENMSLGFFQAHEDLSKKHVVNVSNKISSNKAYFFAVESIDANGNIAVDNNTNKFYTFKTKEAQAKTAESAAKVDVLFINFTLPRYVNKQTIDIPGSTKPFSSLNLYVNSMNIPKRSLSSDEIGSSGKFIFRQVQLDQNNIIKLEAIDKSGNKEDKILEVGVDAEIPIVQLDNLPNLSTKQNLTISGTLNELVIIKVFVDSDLDGSAPAKVSGLNVTKVTQNSIEFKWDESKDKDFSHYVIYRTDSGAIATTNPANFNLFIDALVDSDKSYTYEVTSVNTLGREGPKSNPLAVKTLGGGAILNLKHAPVDSSEDFRQPLMIVNASGKFNFGVRFNQGDGDYRVKLVFEDKAANRITIERTIALDTKRPEVKITSPSSATLIFENTANEVDIIGKTEPNARVHLFVNRAPFGAYEGTLEVTGIPNEAQGIPQAVTERRLDVDVKTLEERLQNISESELESKCPAISRSSCKGADKSVTADRQGNFRFDNVDLTVFFGVAGRLTEVSPTDFRDVQLNPESRQTKKTDFIVVATDRVGQRGVAKQTINIGNCWSGNQSWDIIPLTQFQSPTLLSTERIAEGTETIYFYFNLSYIGRGTNAIISDVHIQKACSRGEVSDARFNMSCKMMPSGARLRPVNEDKTLWYGAVTLNRLPNMDRFLESDWKSFFNALGVDKELTFPLLIRINYQHDMDFDNQKEKETQTTCEQVSYVLDNNIIDPRKVLPDFLLYDFVDFLDTSIKGLNKAQEAVNKALEYVAIGCLASFGSNFIFQTYRRWVEFWDENTYKSLRFFKETFEGLEVFQTNPLQSPDKDYCERTIQDIVRIKGRFRIKYMTDSDLKKCFPKTSGAWDKEANSYQWLRWSCDRVFGHAAPSKWTEDEEDNALQRKVESMKLCKGELDARGQPLRAEKCLDALESFKQLPRENYKLDDKCFRVDIKDANGKLTKNLFELGKPVSDKIYQIEEVDNPSKIRISFAIQKDEFNYLTAQTKSCNDVCTGQGKGLTKSRITFDGRQVTTIKDKKNNERFGLCMTVDKCRSLNVVGDSEEQRYTYVDDDGNPHKINIAETWGFTSDCFYDGESDTDVVLGDGSRREECCCINAKEGDLPSFYYQPNDLDPVTNQPVHQSKKDPITGQQLPLSPGDYAYMDWSYRYYKERFEAQTPDGAKHTRYNPNRYIEGRDKPACFGQNNLLYQALRKEEEILFVDPFKQHEAAFQCVHLAGVSQRLQYIKNLMTSMSTCLIQVRTNGRGDAGVCKELFTQYLCNSIWRLIKLFIDGCSPYDPADIEKQDEDILEYVKQGFRGVYQSASDLQSQITEEYGNAKLNQILGTGEESVARKICLGAFGYDWELGLKTFIDAAYTTPFATLVQPVTRSREFLTVDPVTFKAKYEYRSSWIINPGCDFERYDIYLSCVGRKQLDQYPNQIKCSGQGNSECDCINLPDERVETFFSGRLKQNVLEDKSRHDVKESDVRYDHLKFVLRPDRKILPNIKPNCFPTGYDDGIFYFSLRDKTAKDIFDCHADPLSGSFICGGSSAFANRKGTANFIDIKINAVDFTNKKELVFNVGDTLAVDTTIRKIGTDKCLKITLDSTSEVIGITLNGTHQYQTVFGPPLTIGTRAEISATQGITVNKVNLGNTKDVTFSVRFYDYNTDEFIKFDGTDRIEIDGKPIDFGKLSTDKKFIVNLGASNEIEVTIVDQKLVMKKESAEIEIVEAALPRNNDGKIITTQVDVNGVKKDVGFVSGSIIVHPLGQATTAPQSQSKTLALNLYHIKDDVEAYTNPGDCNFNDQVLGPEGREQERKVTIKVEQKSAESTQGPLIRLNNPLPQKVEHDKYDSLVVTAKITDNAGVKSAQLECKKPDEKSFAVVPQADVRDNLYNFVVNSNELTVAGKYFCSLSASSENEKAKTNDLKIDFEVRCGNKNAYGLCVSGKCCKEGKCLQASDEISAGLQCAKS